MKPWLLLLDDVGWKCRSSQLLLGLIEHLLIFHFLLLKDWIVRLSHGVKCFPARNLTSFGVFLHANLLEP